MKKGLLLVLALMLLFGTMVSVQAETDEITLDFSNLQFEGKWWTLGDLSLQIYLPATWVENTSDYAGDADYEFAFNPEDKSAYLSIRVFMDERSDDYATKIQATFDEIKGSDNAREVEAARLNGLDWITYTVGENEGLGAVCLSDDAILMLETVPGTPEHAGLFAQIMSTLKVVQ